MKKLYLLILFIISQNIYSQVPEPVGEQDRPIILYNAQVHIGNGTIIENGYICFDSGKITHVGCLLYTSPSPRDLSTSRMPSSA